MADEDKTREQLLEELEAARQRNAELEAEGSAGRWFRLIAERSPVGIVAVGQDGEFTYANEAAARTLGYARDEFLTLNLTDVAALESKEEFEQHIGHMLDGVRLRFETRHKAKDGSLRDVDALNLVADDEREPITYSIWHDITERKRAEEALRESEERLAAFLTNSAVVAWMKNEDGRYVFLSDNYQRLFNVRLDDWMGKTDFDVWPREVAEVFRRSDLTVLEGGHPVEVEESAINPDGSLSWWLVSQFVFRDASGKRYVGGLGVDITDRREARERLEASEERYRTLVQENPHGVQEVDSDGIIVFANASHCEMLGYEEAELVGRSVADFLVPGPQRDELPRYIRTLAEDQPAPTLYSQKNLRKDGTVRDVEVSWNYLRDKEGHVRGFISVLTDVTERKRAEEDRRNLEAQVQHAQKLESLGVLAGGIAHDFNNLLTSILGNADLALHKLSAHAPARENIQSIERTSRRAADLAYQMLAYSGKGRFVVEPIEAEELIQEMTHLLEVSISKKAVLRYNFAQNLPTFDADATQIRQVIMNLITNASEALGDQSGIIALSTGVMDCDRAYLDGVGEVLRAGLDEPLPEGRYVYLEVVDTGCGMESDTLDRVFDPFFTTKFTGRGLGMSTVLGIVRGHKGTFEVDSEAGKGTTFKVLFPAKGPVDDGLVVRGKDEDEGEDWRGSGTVLLVDDEEMVRTVDQQMLERMGFSVLTASDGHEALGVFREHAAKIVCVLLDLTMPRLDGEGAFREMRRIRPGVRVLLCSGYSEQDATQRFAGKGLTGFIQKPFDMATLREKLVDVLAADEGEPEE